MEILFFVFLIIAGFVGGFLSGLLGIGGGLVFVPVLISLSSFGIIEPINSISVVLATSLFTTVITSFASYYQHKKIQNVDKKKAVTIILGSIFAAIVIPQIIHNLNHQILVFLLAFVQIVVAINFLFFDGKTRKIKSVKPIILSIFGFIFGAIAIVSGSAGGIFYTPLLYIFTELDFKKSVGTSSLIVVITMAVATTQFLFLKTEFNDVFQIGYVNLRASLPLAIGAILGPKVGIHFLKKSSNRLVKIIFSLFLLIYSLKLLIFS
jgi:uncharacterized membrane protein YfcA